MEAEILTKRLCLRILTESDSAQALSFYTKNCSFFAPFEPTYPENFLTLEYQQLFLRAYLKKYLNQTGFRYHVYLKSNPDIIIGCVGVSSLHLSKDRSCQLYYKLDSDYQHQGYATEAVTGLLSELFQKLSIHRIEADILSENASSIRLVEKLGFQYEGIARSSHFVDGQYRDHLRYALITEEGW